MARKKNSKKSAQKRKKKTKSDGPVHPWRVCPYGEHQVVTHPRNNPPSRTHPDGSVSTVQYWNEVLKPDHPLDPNVVKALIASESAFSPEKLNDKKNSNSARGLMQITNDTRKFLDDGAELKDHYVTVTKKDLNDPGVNICAGIRWLFRKKEIASTVRLKREATWVEAVEEYKGDLKGLLRKDPASQKDVDPFLKYLKEVEKCGK